MHWFSVVAFEFCFMNYHLDSHFQLFTFISHTWFMKSAFFYAIHRSCHWFENIEQYNYIFEECLFPQSYLCILDHTASHLHLPLVCLNTCVSLCFLTFASACLFVPKHYWSLTSLMQHVCDGVWLRFHVVFSFRIGVCILKTWYFFLMFSIKSYLNLHNWKNQN